VIPVKLTRPRSGPFQILCLGAHCDDIEIGCGATLLKLLREMPEVSVEWVVFSSTPLRTAEARASAAKFLRRAAAKTVRIHGFRDGFFPYDGGQLKEAFEDLKADVNPDLIFCSHRYDLHQDHALVAELARNTWRNHLILEYEIPKYDGDLGQPNCFVPVGRDLARRKARHILESFASQRDRHWFDEETFMAILRLRGLECRSPSGYAEAFYAHKMILG